MKDRLRIGRIPYLNLLPIFTLLEEEGAAGEYDYIEGYPSALNRMLREGEVDLSPSSSIEYLRDKEGYFFVEGHSISSCGPIGSILLFSRVPIESLGGHEVFATYQSETSVALLRVMLSRFYGIDPPITITERPFDMALEAHSAYLAIGDEALIARSRARLIDDVSPPAECSLGSIGHQLFYIYDLSELWHLRTGLPFVFALWTGRKSLIQEKGRAYRGFRAAMDRARDSAPENFTRMASGLMLPAEEVVSYWEGIYYGLDENCIKGLKLYEKYLREMEIIPRRG